MLPDDTFKKKTQVFPVKILFLLFSHKRVVAITSYYGNLTFDKCVCVCKLTDLPRNQLLHDTLSAYASLKSPNAVSGTKFILQRIE